MYRLRTKQKEILKCLKIIRETSKKLPPFPIILSMILCGSIAVMAAVLIITHTDADKQKQKKEIVYSVNVPNKMKIMEWVVVSGSKLSLSKTWR